MKEVNNYRKEPFYLPENVTTHWASAENFDAIKGAGGMAKTSRKGSPFKPLKAGETFVMAHAEGMGIIRRMWITISERTPEMLRGVKIEMFWDGAEKPAVSCPIGDFFCNGLGRMVAFQNIWFSNPEARSFNCCIPMPFKKSMKITATNETDRDIEMFFYDVNFTLGDKLDDKTPYFHAYFNRENPTVVREDYKVLPKVFGQGRFLGCNLGVIADGKTYGTSWWGEGEFKMYLDGDDKYPTLCGTGTEDYIGTAWGQGQYVNLYQGCHVADHEKMEYCFYRFHEPDPIYFYNDIMVTFQQIGNWSDRLMANYMEEMRMSELPTPGYTQEKVTLEYLRDRVANPIPREWDEYIFERCDDVSSVAYFYLDSPASNLDDLISLEKWSESLTKAR